MTKLALKYCSAIQASVPPIIYVSSEMASQLKECFGSLTETGSLTLERRKCFYWDYHKGAEQMMS
jgi:hypothetical protein